MLQYVEREDFMVGGTGWQARYQIVTLSDSPGASYWHGVGGVAVEGSEGSIFFQNTSQEHVYSGMLILIGSGGEDYRYDASGGDLQVGGWVLANAGDDMFAAGGHLKIGLGFCYGDGSGLTMAEVPDYFERFHQKTVVGHSGGYAEENAPTAQVNWPQTEYYDVTLRHLFHYPQLIVSGSGLAYPAYPCLYFELLAGHDTRTGMVHPAWVSISGFHMHGWQQVSDAPPPPPTGTPSTVSVGDDTCAALRPQRRRVGSVEEATVVLNGVSGGGVTT